MILYACAIMHHLFVQYFESKVGKRHLLKYLTCLSVDFIWPLQQCKVNSIHNDSAKWQHR